MKECSFGEGITIKPDGINELVYGDLESIYEMIQVEVSGHVESYCDSLKSAYEDTDLCRPSWLVDLGKEFEE